METWRIKPQVFQEDFLISQARYPAFVAGWGSGKSLFGILKGLELSKKYPGNLGLVARREYCDLRDSTIKDFEQYTGKHINESNKEYKLKNGSLIMFRHAKELDTLKNVNLGWFWIEQAEELETEEQFNFLIGRLRRKNVGFRTGFITANVHGHDWIWRLWKKQRRPDYFLSEATTFANVGNLPKDYIASLDALKETAPSIYNRFVLNDWSETADTDVVIPYEMIEKCVGISITENYLKKVVAVDPARFGDDKTVIYALENGKISDTEVYVKKDTMETTGQAIAMKNKHQASLIAVDVIGIGSGIVDRLNELRGNEENCSWKVLAINSAGKSNNPKYYNLRSEMWFIARDLIAAKQVSIPDDNFLKEELSASKFKFNSNGTIQVESKEKIKERLGRSPDRADALVYGLYALGYAPNVAIVPDFTNMQAFWSDVRAERKIIIEGEEVYQDDQLGVI